MSTVKDIIDKMQKSNLSEIPRCNFCANPAIVDGPTLTGQWAYMCELCLPDKSDIIAVSHFGTRLTLQAKNIKQPSEKVLEAIELSSFEDVLLDDKNREVECPNCKSTRSLDPDSVGIITCEGCNSKLHIKEFLPE